MKKTILLLALLLICGLSAQAQRVETSVDTTRNRIGTQFNLTLKTTVDTASRVSFPESRMFGQMEVIRSYVTDTVIEDNRYTLTKRYGLTQFDSGRYTMPRLPVIINGKRVFSDSLTFEITPVVVDTLKQKMFEIKPIIETDTPISDWWWYLLIFIVLIAAVPGIYYFIKHRKNNQPVQEIYKTPIEKATTQLKNLEQKQLWQRGEIKSYYSELTDIARTYIEEEINIPAMESTTSEVIKGLRAVATQKKMNLSKETLRDLENVLMQADLVKFAKSRPMDFEIQEDKKRIEKTIVQIHKAVPEEIEETEDDTLDQLLIEKQLKKKRSKRILITSISVAAFLFVSVVVLIAVKGFDYVKDNLIGHPTKELLNEDWIASEYGNPAVYIETPRVLKRTDVSKALPAEGLALIKEMQVFQYGSIIDNFNIAVMTTKYKQEGQVSLEQAIDVTIQTLEAQGAQNMIVKQEEYQTGGNIEGRKAYGTYSMIDPIRRESTKCYYEIVLFGQAGGLQQVMIVHREDDKYAKEISARVMRSVELKTAQP
jgi:hypothetical protein